MSSVAHPAGAPAARVVTLDRVLAAATVAWLLVPTLFRSQLPGLTPADAFWITVAVLVVGVAVSLGILVWWKRNAVLLNVAQIAAFGVLHFQVYATWGTHHYKADHGPTAGDWAGFTAAHVVRAADVLDVVEDYHLDLQKIKHASPTAGGLIVAMHLTVDVFLLGLLLRGGKKLWKRIKEGKSDPDAPPPSADEVAEKMARAKRLARAFRVGKAVCLTSAVGAYVAVAIAQDWSLWNRVVWPLETVLRLVDVGDVLNTFNLKFHTLPQGFWLSTMAVALRLFAGLYIAEWVALWHLRTLGGAMRTTDELADDLRSPNAAVREAAARVLEERGPKAVGAEAALRLVLADPDPRVRNRAARALARIVAPGAGLVPALVVLLADAEAENRTTALELLRALGPAGAVAVPALGRALGDPSPPVVRAAAEALAHLGPAAAAVVPGLVSSVRTWGGVMFDPARFRRYPRATPDAIPELRQLLASPESTVREAAAFMLGELGHAAACAVPDIVGTLGGLNPKPAQAALKKIGAPDGSAVPALVAHLASKEHGVREGAAAVLKAMGVRATG